MFFGCLAVCLPFSLYFLLFHFAAGKLVFVVFFFPLHAPVLKPDLHLSLGESKSMRHFDAPLAGQVGIKQEFLLQLECLIAAVGLPAPSPTGSCGGKDVCQTAYFSTNSNVLCVNKIIRVIRDSQPTQFYCRMVTQQSYFLKGCNSPVINRCHKAFNWG